MSASGSGSSKPAGGKDRMGPVGAVPRLGDPFRRSARSGGGIRGLGSLESSLLVRRFAGADFAAQPGGADRARGAAADSPSAIVSARGGLDAARGGAGSAAGSSNSSSSET